MAPPKQSCANVAPVRWRHNIVVQATCTCAAMGRSLGQTTIVVLPRQPYAEVALVQWQSATAVPPTYTCAIVA